MSETKYLTREGFTKIQEELVHLRTVKLPKVVEHIRIAREDGVLAENAGYEAARDEWSFIEGRIMNLEAILRDAQLIEGNRDKDTVVLGSKVTVQENDFEPETFQIVGSPEADPSKGRISNESPLGRALVGRGIRDVVEIKTPNGVTAFTIIRIE
jgi:transcription elongation factor GreA